MQSLWQGLVSAPPMAVVLGLVALLLWAQLALWWLAGRRRERQADVQRRVGLLVTQGDQGRPLQLRDARYSRQPRLDRLLRALPGTGTLHRLLDRTDSDLTVAHVLGRMLALASVGAAAAYALVDDPALQPIAAVAAGAVPVVMLAHEATVRVEKLWRQLPDALDLMTRSLRAGHGTGAALQLVASEMPLPIASEFARTYDRYRLGDDLGQALMAMADRNHACRDLRFFAVAVTLQRETGGNLVEILENLARTIRARFTLQAKVRALTAEARLSTYVVGAMPFVTMGALFVLRREYLETAFGDPIGRGMIFAGFAWFAIGLAMMNRVMKVEV